MSLSWECKCMTIPSFHWVVGCVCNHRCSELETVFVRTKYADFKSGIIQCVTGDEKLGIPSSVQNVCFVALLWCCLAHCFASLIDSKILNSMISQRCRVLTCPGCFFLLIILFVCFSPGLKKKTCQEITSKSKRDANSIRIPAFQHQSLTKLHQTGLPRVISCLGLTFKKIAPCGSF